MVLLKVAFCEQLSDFARAEPPEECNITH